MAIEILYFAWVREAIGKDGEIVEPSGDIDTIADLVGWLAGQGDGYGEAFVDISKLRAALDQTFVDMNHPLGDAKELALFPPVTGG